MTTQFRVRDFVLDGALGGARAGMTRSEVQSLLGRPDGWAAGSEEGGIVRSGDRATPPPQRDSWLIALARERTSDLLAADVGEGSVDIAELRPEFGV